jgi:hypothetical protein
MAGNLKRRDVFGDVSFIDITPDDAYLTSEAEMSDNSSSYSFMPMGEDENRVESPKNIMDVPRMFTGRHSPNTPKADKSVEGDDDNGERRVTIWNWREKRKLSGNSAPFKKNLHEYLRKHPDWEEYRGQDKDMNGKKLSPKKRREQNASTPSTPQDTPTKAPMPEPAKHHLPESVEISDNVPIYLHSTDDATKNRTQEMAARRRLIEEEEARQRREEQEAETKRITEAMEAVRRRELQRATAWKAAQEEAQRIQAERDVSKQQAEQSEKRKRQIEDEQNQQAAITQCVSRVASWKRVRLSAPPMGVCF